MMVRSAVVVLWVVGVGVWGEAGVRGGALERAAHYEVESTVLLNAAARREREAGYRLRAALDVAPAWRAPAAGEMLLRFDLHSPQLQLKGKHVNADFLPHKSVLDSYTESTFYAHWKHGLIVAAYLDPEELVDVLNYKKSIISLFQFQSLEGEYNETDISGVCEVLYEPLSENVFRKIKRRCNGEGSGEGEGVAEALRVRRATRYVLEGGGGGGGGGALAEAHAEEVAVVGDGALGLKARAWMSLRARGAGGGGGGGAPERHASLAAALAAAPRLRPAPLTAHMPDTDLFDIPEYASVQEAVRRSAAALEGAAAAGRGGSAAEAAAALRVAAAARLASAAALRELLAREEHHPLLVGLSRALGLAGTRAALAAADHVLHLYARDALLAPALAFLQAFALADRPHAHAVLQLARLAEEAQARPVAEAALLAAAAAAARHPDPKLSDALKDALTKGLARCKEEECAAARLHALGNLRRADVAELLVGRAEGGSAAGGGGGAALAALAALAGAPPAALRERHLRRLTRLALDARAPFEVRAAALDLVVVRRAEMPAPLAGVAAALRRGAGQCEPRGQRELRRVFWQRLRALAARHEPVRELRAALERSELSWDAHAHALAGTSSVLVRETGWRWAGWSAALESVQLARAGLLRRGAVRLLAAGPRADADAATAAAAEVLAVEVWTRGLQAIAGGTGSGGEGEDELGADAEGEAEAVAGGLTMSVGGVRMRGVTLFDGQAELLGHVWAGAGSAPTPALRAVVPAREARARLALLTGGVLAWRVRGALALAIDANAHVSLWWRRARAALEVRAGGAAEAHAAVEGAWGALRAHASLAAQPRLRIQADLDFYDEIALCVRASTQNYHLNHNVTLESACGLAVRRETRAALPAAGRTLALGALNDRACRTLRAADDDEEEEEGGEGPQ